VNVLRRQLKQVLALQPATPEQLNEHFRKFPYSEIAKIWQKEREEKEKWKLAHLPPILELKKERSEEVLLLIKQQRINTLLRGAKFPKYTARGQVCVRVSYV
jgi:hypothetical protein